jgi:putative membrane protein
MAFLKWLAISWAANVIVLWFCTLLPDVDAGSFRDLLVAGALFGVLNTILKPILRLLTLPIAVITLGLIWFFVAMLMLWITSAVVSGFQIEGFWALVWCTILVWIVNVVLDFVPPWRGTR